MSFENTQINKHAKQGCRPLFNLDLPFFLRSFSPHKFQCRILAFLALARSVKAYNDLELTNSQVLHPHPFLQILALRRTSLPQLPQPLSFTESRLELRRGEEEHGVQSKLWV